MYYNILRTLIVKLAISQIIALGVFGVSFIIMNIISPRRMGNRLK